MSYLGLMVKSLDSYLRLSTFWNDYASTKHNVIFVLCGSATSWMEEKISKNKGGLFNRQTCRLYLEPLIYMRWKNFLRVEIFIGLGLRLLNVT